MSVIVTDGLSKNYGQRVGVQELDLRLEEGTVSGFLGPNGVGKTTTIRLLLGFMRPTQGSARILGLDCWRESALIRRDLGYVPGDLRLYSWLTARSALELFGRIRKTDLMARGLELAEDFKLELDVRVSEMSRGMRQKLGLILALAPRPRLLILDEPTSGLDPVMQDKLKTQLRALASEGHTVFFSSHALGEVQELCERVVILRQGRVVADSSLKELRARARREIVLSWRDRDGQAVEPPGCLEILERHPDRWRAALSGPIKDLIQWIATQPLEDVSIGQPDMETLFQEYYQD